MFVRRRNGVKFISNCDISYHYKVRAGKSLFAVKNVPHDDADARCCAMQSTTRTRPRLLLFRRRNFRNTHRTTDTSTRERGTAITSNYEGNI